jgi:outer membrane protein assembly factor BamB
VIDVAKRTVGSRIETGLGCFGIIALGVTLAIVFKWNPWPEFQNWLAERTGTLSEPKGAWTQRVAGTPDAAGITDTAVVAFMGDMVESRARNNGEFKWRKETDWAALAGPATGGVVIISKVTGKGFEAVDPLTGSTKWSNPDGDGAWTYRDAVLTIDCPKAGCSIVNRSPDTGEVRWKIPTGGANRSINGGNSGRVAPRNLDGRWDDVRNANPQPMPRYLGYLADRKLQVIDTTSGRKVREEAVPNDSRVVVASNRTVRVAGSVISTGCRIVVSARDAGGGQQLWQKDGYDLRTTGGAGCEPRNDPPGGGTALIATRLDQRQALLSAVDGRELAVANPGETILGTDGLVGIVRAGDGKKIRALRLDGGGQAWVRDVESSAKVGVTPYAIFITDLATERLVAVDAGSGQVRLDLGTGAEVIGVHPAGVVLGRGRTIGFSSFAASG